ncbi:MAG TPA: exosortase [Pyrinomonadaceae bacterium]|nr:exosortase [Pyrinomonadaceae bacterium]
MSVAATRPIWRVLAISSALVFLYAAVLMKLGHDLWTDENYSHGLLIPFVIGYILWSQRERFSREPVRPSFAWGLAAVVVALLGLWAGVAGAELFVQRLSLVLMLAGVVVYSLGVRFLKLILVPLGLLLLAIPIPAIVFNKIAFPLQLFASRCAVWAMSLLDIPVLRQGNVIELMPLDSRETRKLEVVEACSGIRSLMTLATLAVVFAYFTYPSPPAGGNGGGGIWSKITSYRFWRTFLIVMSAVPIAIFTNALRVSGTGVLARWYGTEVADGFFHSFSGWVIYIAAFVLLLGVGWVLDRFNPSRGQPKATTTSREPRSSDLESGSARSQVVPAEGAD